MAVLPLLNSTVYTFHILIYFLILILKISVSPGQFLLWVARKKSKGGGSLILLLLKSSHIDF